MKCFVYRSEKKAGMFLYLKNKDDLSTLPEGLSKLLGETTFTFEFDLTEEKKLVRAGAIEVMKALNNTGYFLQMPPAKSELLGMRVD